MTTVSQLYRSCLVTDPVFSHYCQLQNRLSPQSPVFSFGSSSLSLLTPVSGTFMSHWSSHRHTSSSRPYTGGSTHSPTTAPPSTDESGRVDVKEEKVGPLLVGRKPRRTPGTSTTFTLCRPSITRLSLLHGTIIRLFFFLEITKNSLI